MAERFQKLKESGAAPDSLIQNKTIIIPGASPAPLQQISSGPFRQGVEGGWLAFGGLGLSLSLGCVAWRTTTTSER